MSLTFLSDPDRLEAAIKRLRSERGRSDDVKLDEWKLDEWKLDDFPEEEWRSVRRGGLRPDELEWKPDGCKRPVLSDL